jgi:hypothetical protein
MESRHMQQSDGRAGHACRGDLHRAHKADFSNYWNDPSVSR